MQAVENETLQRIQEATERIRRVRRERGMTEAMPASEAMRKAQRDLESEVQEAYEAKLKHSAEREREEEEERARKRVDRLKENAGLSERHLQNKMISSREVPEEWYETLYILMENIGKGNVTALIGTRDTGKTQMATELCLFNIYEHQKACLYAHVMDFFMDLKSVYRSNGDEQEVLAKYLKPSLLVLDELQVRCETQWENLMLDYIVDKRYRLRKDTLLIANVEFDKFEEYVGGSIARRCNETGRKIQCNWSLK